MKTLPLLPFILIVALLCGCGNREGKGSGIWIENQTGKDLPEVYLSFCTVWHGSGWKPHESSRISIPASECVFTPSYFECDSPGPEPSRIATWRVDCRFPGYTRINRLVSFATKDAQAGDVWLPAVVRVVIKSPELIELHVES